MPLRLTPRNAVFYDLFATSARHLVTGAELLAGLVAAPPGVQREDLARRMRDAEHAADDSTHELLRAVNSSFITPFDREDIYTLASRLDDCMDAMEEASDRVVLYRIGELPAGVAEQVRVLGQMAALTAQAMPRLRTTAELSDYWVEVNRLENLADGTYRALVAELFDGSLDAISVLKLKEVVDALEQAADAFEHVAHTVEGIAVKES